ncbi:unnamed protein product [Closterium sp. NIES-53]
MPSPMVRQAAAGFINSYLGSSTSSSSSSSGNLGGDSNGGVRAAGDGGAGGAGGGGFMALHMRRGDFYQHCVNMKGHSKFACYHPIRQLAACVARRLDENPGVRAIYLSTNGDDDEGEGEAAGEAVGGATAEEGEEAEAEGEEACADSGLRVTVEKVTTATTYIRIHLAGVAGSAEVVGDSAAEGEEAEEETGGVGLAGGGRGGGEGEEAATGEGGLFWAGGVRTVRGMAEGLVGSGGGGKE